MIQSQLGFFLKKTLANLWLSLLLAECVHAHSVKCTELCIGAKALVSGGWKQDITVFISNYLQKKFQATLNY